MTKLSLVLEIEQNGNRCIAYDPRFSACGGGATAGEAVNELIDMLFELRDELAAFESALSSQLEEQFGLLESAIHDR